MPEPGLTHAGRGTQFSGGICARWRVLAVVLALTALPITATAFHDTDLRVLDSIDVATRAWGTYDLTVPAEGAEVAVEAWGPAETAEIFILGIWVLDENWESVWGPFWISQGRECREERHVEALGQAVVHRSGSCETNRGAIFGVGKHFTLDEGRYTVVGVAASDEMGSITLRMLGAPGVNLSRARHGRAVFLRREIDFDAPLKALYQDEEGQGLRATAVVGGAFRVRTRNRLFGFTLPPADWTSLQTVEGPSGLEACRPWGCELINRPPGSYEFRIQAGVDFTSRSGYYVFGADVPL